VGCGGSLHHVSLRVLTGSYLASIPIDPQAATSTLCPRTATGTCYTIMKDAHNRVTVAAPGAERGAIISATR
jgi:hypothetical protein